MVAKGPASTSSQKQALLWGTTVRHDRLYLEARAWIQGMVSNGVGGLVGAFKTWI